MDTAGFSDYVRRGRAIVAALDPLCRYARGVLSGYELTRDEALILTDYIVDLRRLISELAEFDDRISQNGVRRESMSVLKEKFLELEGIVKEKRNTLTTKNGA